MTLADIAPDRHAMTGNRWRGLSPLKSVLILSVLVFLAYAVRVLAGPNPLAPTYDGWRVGALDTCPMPYFDPARPWSAAECEASLGVWLSAAREGFDRRDPAHATVVRATLHQHATTVTYTTTCCLVAVFELGDGTVRAIGVEYWMGNSGFIDYTRVVASDYGPGK